MEMKLIRLVADAKTIKYIYFFFFLFFVFSFLLPIKVGLFVSFTPNKFTIQKIFQFSNSHTMLVNDLLSNNTNKFYVQNWINKKKNNKKKNKEYADTIAQCQEKIYQWI